MEPGSLMPHSQGLSNNQFPEPNQPKFFFVRGYASFN